MCWVGVATKTFMIQQFSKYALILDLPITNNEAEYEVLITVLGLAGMMKVKNMKYMEI